MPTYVFLAKLTDSGAWPAPSSLRTRAAEGFLHDAGATYANHQRLINW